MMIPKTRQSLDFGPSYLSLLQDSVWDNIKLSTSSFRLSEGSAATEANGEISPSRRIFVSELGRFLDFVPKNGTALEMTVKTKTSTDKVIGS